MKSVRNIALGALLLTAGAMNAQDNVYIVGDIFGWDANNPVILSNKGNGVFETKFYIDRDEQCTFKLSTVAYEGWEGWQPAVLVPAGALPVSTNNFDKYMLGPSNTFEYEVWGADRINAGDYPNDLELYHPGDYTLTVDTNKKTVTISGTPDQTCKKVWSIKGEFDGWGPGVNFDMSYKDGVYHMKGHVDRLDGNFKIVENDTWRYLFYRAEEITDFGTYDFNFCLWNAPDAFAEVPLENVNIDIEWDQNNFTTMKVTLSDASSGVNDVLDNSDAKAEYFTLNGLKVAREGLAPGIYVCRKGAETSKVVIK